MTTYSKESDELEPADELAWTRRKNNILLFTTVILGVALITLSIYTLNIQTQNLSNTAQKQSESADLAPLAELRNDPSECGRLSSIPDKTGCYMIALSKSNTTEAERIKEIVNAAKSAGDKNKCQDIGIDFLTQACIMDVSGSAAEDGIAVQP